LCVCVALVVVIKKSWWWTQLTTVAADTKLLTRERILSTENVTLQQKVHDLTLRVTAGIGLPSSTTDGSSGFSTDSPSSTSSPVSSSSDLLLYKKLSELQEEIRTLSQQLTAAKLESSQKNEEYLPSCLHVFKIV